MDAELLTVLDLDALQPARSIVQLALEQYGSDNLFQQLLSFESALEALKEITDKLADRLDHIPGDSEGFMEASVKSQGHHQEFQSIGSFAIRLEELRAIVRDKFNLRAQKLLELRGGRTRRFPDDFPDELLLKIVGHLESTFDETCLRFNDEFSANNRAIRNLRLTCRRLCEIASSYLVPYLHVTPSLSSLSHLEQVTSHPTISRGLRRIFVNVAVLTPDYADDFTMFSFDRHETLKTVLNFCRKEKRSHSEMKHFEKEASNAYEVFQSLMPLPDYARNRDKYAPDGYDRDGNYGRGLLEPELYDKYNLNASQIALWGVLRREHERNLELYEEQKNLLQSGQFTHTVAAAVARARSNICLYISDQHRAVARGDPFGLKQALRKHRGRHVDHDFVFRSIGGPEGHPWKGLRDDKHTKALQNVLYGLPLAIGAAGATLTGLRVDASAIWSHRRPALDITEEQTSDLEQACRGLKRFKFQLGYSEEIESLLSYLSAVTSSQMIESLDLDLRFISDDINKEPPPHTPCVIGPLRLSETCWDQLKTLSLKSYSVHLDQLETLLSVLRPGTDIALEQICLLTGTWAEALDCIRSKAGKKSEVTVAAGSECRSMTMDWQQLIFGSFPGMLPLYNRVGTATQYVRRLDGITNPVREWKLSGQNSLDLQVDG